MAEQISRLARPSSVLEEAVPSARGINRSQLTLYLSIAAIILSVAGAGVHLFIYLNGERNKMAAETNLAKTVELKEQALARAAQLDVALKEQQIKTSAAQQQEALAAALMHTQDTRTKRKVGELNEAVLTPGLMNTLGRAAEGAATGNPNILGVPPSSFVPAPISRGAAGVPGWGSPSEKKQVSGWGVKESTSK